MVTTQKESVESPEQRLRFTKADRLLKRFEFVHLATNAKKIGNRHFIVFYEQNKQESSRLGITVSRKVGKAVTRNRIKRIARECFRRHRPDLSNHWDLHIIAKRQAADISNQALTQSMHMLLKRIDASQNE